MLMPLIPSSLRGFMSSACQRSQNTLCSVIVMPALSVGFPNDMYVSKCRNIFPAALQTVIMTTKHPLSHLESYIQY